MSPDFARRFCISALALFVVARSAVYADWAPNGVPVCTTTGDQGNCRIIPDGAGGVIIAWGDERSQDEDVYAQRLDSTGQALWTLDGVGVCVAFMWQRFPDLVSDGAQGAIITWCDFRIGNAEIYAQRLDAAGMPVWGRNGVPVATFLPAEAPPTVITDGRGGAIIAWEDFRVGAPGIYAQRIDASGGTQWTANGIPICTTSSTWNLRAISDGAGGALFVWHDTRDRLALYGQRIDAGGNILWTKDGVLVAGPLNTHTDDPAQLATDGSEGMIVVWPGYDLLSKNYVQRVDALGERLWGDNGLPLCPVLASQKWPTVVADGGGGAFLAWSDNRRGDLRSYAQRFDASGTALWPPEGVSLCDAAGGQVLPQLAISGNGGFVAVWTDGRAPGLGDQGIYAQRVDGSGNLFWGKEGKSVCNVPGNRGRQVICSTGPASVVVAWDDSRGSGSRFDIYAQQLEAPTSVIVQEFSASQTPAGLKLHWRLAREAVESLDSVRIQKALAPDGPWVLLVQLQPHEPIEFEDFEVQAQAAYWYRLLLVGGDQSYLSQPTRVHVAPVGQSVVLHPPQDTPEGVLLPYFLPQGCTVRLSIHDIRGRLLRRFDLGSIDSGEHWAAWDRHDHNGTLAPRGLYFVRLEAGRQVRVRKLPPGG